MNIKQLQALILTIKFGSVSKVAEILGITQSGVSRTLKTLENNLKKELFYRENNKLIPTEHAIRLSEKATPILNDFSELKQEFSSDSLVSSSEFMNIVMPSNLNLLFVLALDNFSKIRPNVRVNILPSTSANVINKMLQGYNHLGATTYETPIIGGVHCITMTTSPVCCLVHKDSHLAKLKVITTEVLKTQKIIVSFASQSSTRQYVEKKFREHGIKNAPLYAVDTYTACEMAKRKMGIVFTFDLMARVLLENNDDIIILPFEGDISQPLNWIIPNNAPMHPDAKILMEEVQKLIHQYSPSSQTPVKIQIPK